MRSEQPAAIALPPSAGEGLALEGLYGPGDGEPRPGAAVVAPPHPLYGGRMDNPVVTELALRLDQLGRASLRFNWRGVGGSAGTASGENDVADEDYAAALAFLADSVPGPLLAAGYSFGSAAALRCAAENGTSEGGRVAALALVAPPPALLDASALERFDGPIFVAVGDGDEFAPLADVETLFASREGAVLEVLDGTDHFFARGTNELGRAFARWLERR